MKSIRQRFFPGTSDPELPEQRLIMRSTDYSPSELLTAAADHLGCDTQAMKHSLRIPCSVKADRDLLLYFIWSTGLVGNRELGALFGLTSSSVSKQVYPMHAKMRYDATLKAKLHELYSLFKM